MKKIIIFSTLILTMFACKKDNIEPQSPVAGMLMLGDFTHQNGETMTCDMFYEMYFKHRLDVTAQGYSGIVTFNEDGSCTNYLNPDGRFVKWKFYKIGRDSYCNVLNATIKNDQGQEKETQLSFQGFYETGTRAYSLSDGVAYFFAPQN